jgi:hypothetical protein
VNEDKFYDHAFADSIMSFRTNVVVVLHAMRLRLILQHGATTYIYLISKDRVFHYLKSDAMLRYTLIRLSHLKVYYVVF